MATIADLAARGQSVWLDFLSRKLLRSGELAALIASGVRGVTDNPTILDKAISGSPDYDDDVVRLARQGRATEEIYEYLALSDVGAAADMLQPVFEKTGGTDGFVSLEVDPHIAYDTEASIGQAQHLFHALSRPNVFIKVPATDEGVPAIETLISRGINVNITLIFSQEAYHAVVEAYLRGLEQRLAAGLNIGGIASVASFFVSRVDTATDKQLQAKGNEALQGKIGVANAKVAYEYFQGIVRSGRWQELAAHGAHVQRPLWASTSTKNPRYPDTLYVDNLIGADTVNTMPEETLHAFLDHGRVSSSLTTDVEEAHRQLDQLAATGVDLHEITEQLTIEGVELFSKSYENLLALLENKRATAIGEQRGKAA